MQTTYIRLTRRSQKSQILGFAQTSLGGIHSLKPEKLCLVYSGDLYFLTTILKVISAMTILVFVFYLLPWLCDLHFLKIPFLWLSSTNCSGQQGCIGPTPSAPKENKELD